MSKMSIKIKLLYSKIPVYIRLLQKSVIMKNVQFSMNSTNLDLGAGDGWMTKHLLKKLPYDSTLFAADISQSKYMHISKEMFVKCDAHKLPFENKSFDLVVMSSVLQVVRNYHLVIEELTRVLKDEGQIIITVPVGYPIIKKVLNARIFFFKTNAYSKLLSETNSLFKINGNGFFNHIHLIEEFKKKGYLLENLEYTPGVIGSFIFQILLLIRYLLGCKRLTSKLDNIFYPLTMLDKYFNFQNGIEVCLKLKKVNK